MTRASLADHGVRLLVDADEIWLESGRSWRVGLIVAELIRNAARHGLGGGPGAIRVEIVKTCG
jgi:two-component sensor histidine kinase